MKLPPGVRAAQGALDHESAADVDRLSRGPEVIVDRRDELVRGHVGRREEVQAFDLIEEIG